MLDAVFPLLRPLLHRIDPELAHDLAIRALEMLPLSACPPDDPRLALPVLGLSFPNPVGLAAGFDKNARVPDAALRLGFGFVELGGVTPLPQPGNPKPRVFRLARDEAIINRYGLNSEGMEAVAARLAARRRCGIVGVNLGANKEAADRTADYVTLVRRLAPLADFLTINISSPNTPGLRDLQGKASLDELLARVMAARDEGGGTRILLKIAPDLDDLMLDDIVAVARARKIDGMIVSNTTIDRPSGLRDAELAQETGGLSGRPLFRASTILLAKAFLRAEGAFPLIGVGGIASGEDALAKIAAGATLIQFYSALIYQGTGLIGAIKSAILDAIQRAGATSPAGLIGRDAADWARQPP